MPVIQERSNGNVVVGKVRNEGTGIWLVGSVRSSTTVRVEFIADLFESIKGRGECIAERFESSTVRVECISDRFESSTLQVELVTVQDESIALLQICVNN